MTTLRTWRFIVLLLVALGLIPGGAHVLELPPKMGYEAELYATVTSTLYRFFGLVGGVVQVSSILAAAVLSFLVRGRSTFRSTLAGTLSLVVSWLLWMTLVAPVNAEWFEVIESAPEFVPAAYERLRPRWEYGHVAAFTAWFIGFNLLLLSVIGDTPAHHLREGGE